jgi:hypothetical protein
MVAGIQGLPSAARVRFAGGSECDLGRAGLLAPAGRGRFTAAAAVALVPAR